MEENGVITNRPGNPGGKEQERMYSASEVEAIVNQYRIQLDTLKRRASEEIEKRDSTNFYQTLSILFEIVRNSDSYPIEFVDKCTKLIVNSVDSIITPSEPEKRSEQEKESDE